MYVARSQPVSKTECNLVQRCFVISGYRPVLGKEDVSTVDVGHGVLLSHMVPLSAAA